ncbi:unnamed protein product [Phyllotreta striolata]|uniref:Uncharacterized protein n=1 Tax=Phyllotreta striolata TaxID=444603 RepID=A0A9N9XT97_PHYSR|nr:unnamed protein product [Phyllotreta striolata]
MTKQKNRRRPDDSPSNAGRISPSRAILWYHRQRRIISMSCGTERGRWSATSTGAARGEGTTPLHALTTADVSRTPGHTSGTAEHLLHGGRDQRTSN